MPETCKIARSVKSSASLRRIAPTGEDGVTGRLVNEEGTVTCADVFVSAVAAGP